MNGDCCTGSLLGDFSSSLLHLRALGVLRGAVPRLDDPSLLARGRGPPRIGRPPWVAARQRGATEDSAAGDPDTACAVSTWFVNYDGDGFGSERLTWSGCEAITGYVANKDDCDDADAWIHPGATEDCDGVDNDCDGVADLCGGEAAGTSADFAGDTDDDGFGDVVVGAPGYNGASENCGVAYLVRGPIGGSLDLAAADRVWEGESYSDDGGYAVAGVGDVDGNGLADWMVAAPGDDDGGGDAGAASLFLRTWPD